MSIRRFTYPFLIILSLLGVFSCSVEKNTAMSRNFHNLTSHYNIYFNGNESFKKGIAKAGDIIENDYTQVLPLFYFQDEAVQSGVAVDMKRAIDKATKVITFHSITAKPKVKEGNQSPRDKAFFEKNEYNKWVDDSYMLMGKAYMYQGEFFLAAETFKHILVTFPEEDIHYLAMIWLARSYIMTKDLREAERILTSLNDASEMPEDYLEAYYTTRADYHLYREEYDQAADYLDQALRLKGLSKEQKIRYTYTLAQLYEKTEQDDLALKAYRRVTRYNPPYEMAFNAKVSMAEVYKSGTSGSEDLKKLLNKMLKDSKNSEYLDQIYYALGNIAFEEGNKENAINYYQQSVASSLKNNFQKGLSSLTLAELYYKEPDYMLSAAYYDSAVTFLDRDYPDYNELSSLSVSLGGLVNNINSYHLEDSVQMLAGLPEPERLAIIDQIIEEVKEKEEKEKLAKQQAMQDMAYNRTQMYGSGYGGKTGDQQQEGKWYFYNLNAKSFGQPEFRMKWGDRKLEDNWRRKNKQTISELSSSGEAAGDSIKGSEGVKLLDNKSREFYLANIPLTDSAMKESNKRLESALFNMGVIYKEDLLDYNESIQSFEELLRRFPDGRYTPTVLYNLYDLYNSVQNNAKAQSYKNQLVSSYPDSHYAKLLNNPNYIQELEEEEKKALHYYESVYEDYKNKLYASVVRDADYAVSTFEDDPLVPKFKYIQALSIGATEGKEAMKTALDSLISQYPDSEEGKQAKEIVDYMYVAFPVIKEKDQAKQAEEIYVYTPERVHYFAIALRTGEDLNQVNFDLLNYNLDNFNQYDLSIDKVTGLNNYNLLVVKTFTNAEGAERYLNSVRENMDLVLKGIAPDRYRIMIISDENYKVLTGQKELNPYYLFYQKFYTEGE